MIYLLHIYIMLYKYILYIYKEQQYIPFYKSVFHGFTHFFIYLYTLIFFMFFYIYLLLYIKFVILNN